MKYCFTILLIALGFTVFAGNLQRGIFMILRGDDIRGNPEKLIALDAVDGVVLYPSLRMIRPEQNGYDFAALDRVLDLCQKHGKKVNLALIAGRWVPEWIYTERHAEPFVWEYHSAHVDAGHRTQKAPVPWDQNYLAVLAETVKVMAERYRNHPALVSVQITGPALENGLEANMNLSTEDARRIGYTPEKLRAAWQTMFDCYAQAYPAQNLSWCPHDMFPGERSKDFAVAMRDWASQKYGDRLTLTICYLTHQSWFAAGNPTVDLWAEQPEIRKGAQLIDIYSAKKIPPAEVAAALRKGKAMGAGYFEIFAEDFRSKPYLEAIEAVKPELSK